MSVFEVIGKNQKKEELVINSGRVPKISSKIDSKIIINNYEKGRIIDFIT